MAGRPGYYQLQAPSLAKEPPVTYFVQLPPEYDPYRLYPTVVTLCGRDDHGRAADRLVGRTQPARAACGRARPPATATSSSRRCGPSSGQGEYGYSAREHAAVLNSLRDACRRFVDRHRPRLSLRPFDRRRRGLGHRPGPPDLWAGVIPIVATADRYCDRYWKNARYVPFYVVAGGLDGGRLAKNSLSLDRYLRYGFNTTVVEFLGRGHEDFYEEILRIFDWMGHFHRNFYPRDFTCETMRDLGQFLLVGRGRRAAAAARPSIRPTGRPANGLQPVQVHGSATAANGLNVQAGASEVTVWLSPKLLDFKQRASHPGQWPAIQRRRSEDQARSARAARKTSAPAATASIPSGPSWKARPGGFAGPDELARRGTQIMAFAIGH